MEETLKIKFVGDAGDLNKVAGQASDALGSVSDAVKKADVTWKEFVGQRMSSYMKEFGGHGPAIKKIGEEWKAYKDTLGNVSKATTQVSSSLSASTKAMAQSAAVMGGSLKKGSGEATQSLINLSRVAQDAPYGFIGIANNLNPLLESFQRLKQSTGSVGGSLKALGSELMGAGGIGLALGVASSLLVVFGDKLFGAGKSAEQQVSRIDALKKSLKDLTGVASSEILGGAGSEFSKAVSAIETLRENVDLAKKGFIDKKEVVNQYNKELGDTIGKVKTLDEVEKAIADKGNAYLKFTLLKAAAQQALAKASDSALLAAENEAKASEISTNAFVQSSKKLLGQLGATTAVDNLNKSVQKSVEPLKKATTDANRQKDRFIGIFKEFQDQAAAIAKDNNFTFNPTIKPETPKGDKSKTAFLFDFLPFDPSGNLKPEQRGEVLSAIDKFSKEFTGILKGVNFSALAKNDSEKIKLALKFDADLKAGNVKIDLTKLKAETEKALKPEDLLPPDQLKELPKLVVDQFIRSYQNESERIKNLNPLNISSLFNFNTDLSGQIDLFKTRLQQLGAKIPATIEAIDIFGNPVEVTFDELSDTSKIANNDALAALQKALDKLRGQAVDKKKQFVDDLNKAFENLQIGAFTSLGQGLADAFSGAGIDKAFRGIGAVMGDFIQQLGQMLIKTAVIAEAFKKAFAALLKSPAAAIAVGVGMIALGGIIKNTVLPKPKAFAQGGLAFGPTLGLVGEGIGTSRTNPEVIAPLDKLKQFINPNGGATIVGGELRLNGRDLVAALALNQQSQQRNFGRK